MAKISKKLIQKFKKNNSLGKIINLSEAEKALDTLSEIDSSWTRISKRGDLDPSFKVYVQMQNMLSIFSEEISVLDDFVAYYDMLEKFDYEFMPSYPLMSPVTNSYFSYFCLCDFRFGKEKVTMGSIFKDIATAFEFDTLFIKAIENLNQSTVKFYKHIKVENGLVELEDILTNDRKTCVSTSNYVGKPNQIWFVRLVPNLDDIYDYQVILNTPYVILEQDEKDWIKYFERQGIEKNDPEMDAKIVSIMKHNRDPKFWLDYIMDAFVNYESNCIYLTGIPDIKGSKPHEL
jgi:hypothetical protein